MRPQIFSHCFPDDINTACGLAGLHLPAVCQSGDGFVHGGRKRDLDAPILAANP
jgi:hypothetical protein